MDRNWNQYLTRYRTATIPSPVLPECCPHCGAEICWGWATEEEIEEPVIGPCAGPSAWPAADPALPLLFCGRPGLGPGSVQAGSPESWRRVRIQRIPRPDQTVFCPNCEAQILN